jgi:hypothetical protein
LLDILAGSGLPTSPGQVITGDKNCYSRDFEAALATAGLTLLRPQGRARTSRPPVLQAAAPGHQSINDTLNGQLDLERHGRRTTDGAFDAAVAVEAAVWPGP